MVEGVRGKTVLHTGILGQSENAKSKSAARPSERSPRSCPQCGSTKLFKDGKRKLKDGSEIQRFLCRSCFYRFSESHEKVNVRTQLSEMPKSKTDHLQKRIVETGFSFKGVSDSGSFGFREDSGLHRVTNAGKALYVLRPSNSNAEYAHKKAKNLSNARELETLAGERNETQQDIRGKIVQFIWQMQKDNYSKETITTYSKALQRLIDLHADLSNPESVKETLTKMKNATAYKYVIGAAYTLFLKTYGLTWKPPICNVTRSLPFIPTERELDDLIAGCGKKTAVFLQILKETALRVGECSRLKWINVDLDRKTITLNEPEKNGIPRMFDISSKLVSMLAVMPKETEYVFGTCQKVTRASVFYRLRKRLSRKLGNPRLLEISLHTFRHWKATTLYHETKNPLLVKEFLGHRNLDTTLLYIQLEKHLYKEDLDTFTVKAVKDAEEIGPLLEVGFEYVCQKDGLTFFRKRK